MCVCACVCVCVYVYSTTVTTYYPRAVLEPSHRVKLLLKGGRMRFAEGIQEVDPLVIRFKEPVVVHSIQLLNGMHSSE